MLTDKVFKLLSDKTRLRLLMLIDDRELCVCQIMAVLGVSQPLVSKNLSLLNSGGFLDERRDGKLVFYRVRKELPTERVDTMELLRKHMKKDIDIINDKVALKECMEYQKKKGTCDMKTFQEYMRQKKRRQGNA